MRILGTALLLGAMACAGAETTPPSTATEWQAFARRHPENVIAQVYAGHAALRAGDARRVDQALAALADTARRTDGGPEAAGGLALAAAKQEVEGPRRGGLLEIAIRHLREAQGSRSAAFNLGHALLLAGRAEEAVAALEGPARAAPLDREALRLLARALMAADDPRAALEVVKREDAGARRGAEDEALEGDALFLLSRFEEATGAYRRALGREERRASTWNNLGLALREMGRPEEAEACLAKSRALRLSR